MKPKLNWKDEFEHVDGSKGRYFKASVCEVVLFVHPHGWDVYHNQGSSSPTHLRGPFSASTDDLKVQAEMAARELLKPSKAEWDALWSEE